MTHEGARDPGPLFGPYRTERLLGRGAMGQVHLARDDLGRPVAVKVVHSFLARDTEFRTRFRREVAAARAVDSPRTASLLDADPDAQRPWLASEYVDGPTLATLLAQRGPLDPPRLRALADALATALHAIHQAGLVHRDLKPSNILIAATGPCVIDFGIARATDATRLTATGMALGSAGFAAPEQLSQGESTPAGDVFALGAVLATAATGRRPFGDGPSHAAAYRTVHEEPDLAGAPEDLLPLLARCLAKDPTARPSTVTVTAEAGAPRVSWVEEAKVRAPTSLLPGPVDAVAEYGAAEATRDVTGSHEHPTPTDRPPPEDGDWLLAAPAKRTPAPAGGVSEPSPPPTDTPPAGDTRTLRLAGPPAPPVAPPSVPPGTRWRAPRGSAAAWTSGAVALVASLGLVVFLTLQGGSDGSRLEGKTSATPDNSRPAPSSTPVVNPTKDGSDRALGDPTSHIPGLPETTGTWSLTWDERTPEPEAGEDVNESRGSELSGAWLTAKTLVRANERDVRGYSSTDGRLLWKAEPPEPGLVPCAVSRSTSDGVGAVAFGSDPRSFRGCDRLVALRVETGERLWQTDLRPRKQQAEKVTTTVAIAGGRVVVKSFSALVAYDLQDGRAVWQRSWKDEDDCWLWRARAAQSSVSMVSYCPGENDEEARTKLPERVSPEKGGRLRVSQLNASDGTERWTSELVDDLDGANILTVQPLTLILSVYDSDANLFQLFSPRGRAHPPMKQQRSFGELQLYGGTSGPEIHGWRNTIATKYWNSSTKESGVVTLDAETGKVRWHKPRQGDLTVFGMDGDGVLTANREGDSLSGQLKLDRWDLEDGTVRHAGALPRQMTDPVGEMRFRKDTLVMFPSLDFNEGAALYTAPGS